MGEEKRETWTATYVAIQKRCVFERQTVEVKLTLEQFVALFKYHPDESDDVEADLQELAMENGEPDDSKWEPYLTEIDYREEKDFEVKLDEEGLTLADIQVALDEMVAAGIVIENDGKYSLPPEKED